MSEPSLHTRPSLLVRLHDEGDQEAWRCFVEAYAPMLHRILRQMGMQDADLLDVSQEVMAAVVVDIRKFRGDRPGSFRRWLFTIVRNRASDYWRRERRHTRGSGESDVHRVLGEMPAEGEALDEQWNREFLQDLFSAAATQVKSDFEETTWNAFWRTTVEQDSAQMVASDLGISLPALYMAKRRVLLRIREQIEFLQGETI